MVNGPVRRCRAHKYRCLFLYPFALFASLACAQDLPIPTVDSLPTSTRKVATPPLEVKAPTQQPHRFWDRTNILLFSGVGAMRALDYASTRNMQRRGREEILLPDDVVNNSAGFAALEAAGTARRLASATGCTGQDTTALSGGYQSSTSASLASVRSAITVWTVTTQPARPRSVS